MTTNRFARPLILSLVAATTAFASAQQTPPMPGHPPVPPMTAQHGPAQQVTVTYFDKDPRGSSRPLGTARIQLPAGERHGELRRLLKQSAPKGATFARLTVNGHTMILPLKGGRPMGHWNGQGNPDQHGPDQNGRDHN